MTTPLWTDEELQPPAQTPFGPLLTPARSLAAPKNSHRWRRLPGHGNRLNCRAIWPATTPWGIPELPGSEFAPARLVAYNASRRELAAADPETAVHCFLDGYRIGTLWSQRA